MANALYPKFKEALLGGDIGTGLDAVNVKAYLIDLADYTYSAAHVFLSEVAAGAIVDSSLDLTSKTITNGVFDSADPVFAAASGDPSEAIILAIDTGSTATSRLIAFYDTGVTGLPVTPNSGDINVQVNASGWFAL